MKFSVCMATYNGSIYILEQLYSILDELYSTGESFEIIIIDDASHDETVEIVNRLKNKSIKIFKNEVNIGHVKSFERALGLAKGEYIFLSDQDDIWTPGRVEVMVSTLKSNKKSILFSGFKTIDSNKRFLVSQNQSFVFPPNHKFRLYCFFLLLLGRADYWGCTVLLTKNALKKIMPFPIYIEAHDHWIAIVGLIGNDLLPLHHTTLLHRIHSKNITGTRRRSFLPVLRTRYLMFRSVFYAIVNEIKSKL